MERISLTVIPCLQIIWHSSFPTLFWRGSSPPAQGALPAPSTGPCGPCLRPGLPATPARTRVSHLRAALQVPGEKKETTEEEREFKISDSVLLISALTVKLISKEYQQLLWKGALQVNSINIYIYLDIINNIYIIYIKYILFTSITMSSKF